MSSKLKTILIILLVLIVAIGAFATQVGFYSIQPIGAVPQGSTWLVWRKSGERFFNSADAMALEKHGSVSLMSRAMALVNAPKDRIIIKFSYWNFAYQRSVGGK